MSKSDLPQHPSNAGDERPTQRPRGLLAEPNRHRDSVTPCPKDMVDDVTTGAVSIRDDGRTDGEPWEDVLPSATEKSSSGRHNSSGQRINPTMDSSPLTGPHRPSVRVIDVRACDDEVCSSVRAEQVTEMVLGLPDIEIGDSTYALPVDVSNIEDQVKRAARNINSLEWSDMETAQSVVCDGQGDLRTATPEAEMGTLKQACCEAKNDASKVPLCSLRTTIEEFGDNDSTEGNSPDHRPNESLASWEESEEKFVQIIEGAGDERGTARLEFQECNYRMIFDEDSMALNTGDDGTSGTIAESSVQNRRAFGGEEVIDDQKIRIRPSDRSDNYSDEEPYWWTAGLTTEAAMSPQNGDTLSSKTTIAGEDSVASGLGGNCQRSEIEAVNRGSVSVVEHAANESGVKDKSLKLKSTNTPSLGRRLRKFFSRSKPREDCPDAS